MDQQVGRGVETQVSVLYECAREKYAVDLCAGADGLANATTWVYLAEDINNASFLKGGELVITTGLFTREGVSLLDFVRMLAMRDCSGVLVNVGPYLGVDDLTGAVREFCDANHLPLFTMPWEVHLVDIMQEFSMLLLEERQRLGSINAAFEAALYQTPVPERALRGLHQAGFDAGLPYRVAVIHNLAIPGKLSSPLNRRGVRYHLFRHENLHVLVYQRRDGGLSDEQLVDLICYCDGVALGMSGVIPDLAELGSAYRRALFSLAVAELWQRPYVGFDELGMLQLLFCVSDQRLLEDLHDTYLGALEDYDRQHDTELVHTLKVYLLADGNLLEAAARLPAHRNTVVYRLRRVKEILEVNLEQATVKFNLLLALYIREYLSM
ncbi:PucR family transcriptional regulator [Propionicimonas sp.]|uniref:PucR family transcriptional regulator n=1 Tax=Propionicimonas sp. TaxID=1955623 RepID=UPI0039E3A901